MTSIHIEQGGAARLFIGLGASVLAGVCLAAPASKPASAPKSNLDYWLDQGPASRAASQPTSEPAQANPFEGNRFGRPDALPGVVELSDGSVLAGALLTTAEKDWEVWVASEKRWRHIPPILVLSLTAVVVEEALEPEWRWKEMGSDEKVFTGRKRPFRRFEWRFHLLDDSVVTGAVKGQPLWLEPAGATGQGGHAGASQPAQPRQLLILHERSVGQYGQGLADLVYLKRAVISRRALADAW